MSTRVTRDQFEFRDGVFIHKPTQSEFTPNPNSEGSFLVYTGNIACRLKSGEAFDYGEVLAMMKTVWRETCVTGAELQKVEAYDCV
jgi:hypothetical protein